MSKDIKLNEDNLKLYLENLFNAIEGFQNPVEKLESFRQPRGVIRKASSKIQAAEAFKTTKKNKGKKRISKRTTRKLRR